MTRTAAQSARPTNHEKIEQSKSAIRRIGGTGVRMVARWRARLCCVLVRLGPLETSEAISLDQVHYAFVRLKSAERRTCAHGSCIMGVSQSVPKQVTMQMVFSAWGGYAPCRTQILT